MLTVAGAEREGFRRGFLLGLIVGGATIVLFGVLEGCQPPPVPVPPIMHRALSAQAGCTVPSGCFLARTLDASCHMTWCFCPRVCGVRTFPLWRRDPAACVCPDV